MLASVFSLARARAGWLLPLLLAPRTLETVWPGEELVHFLISSIEKTNSASFPLSFQEALQSVVQTYPGPRVALCLFTKANRAILVSTTEGTGNWSEYQFS